MKKIFASLAIAAAMFAFVACSSPVEKAKQYAADIEAAEAAGDYEKAAKLEKEMAEWMASLSEEEKAEVLAAALEEAGF